MYLIKLSYANYQITITVCVHITTENLEDWPTLHVVFTFITLTWLETCPYCTLERSEMQRNYVSVLRLATPLTFSASNPCVFKENEHIIKYPKE